MKPTILFALPALLEVLAEDFRQIKYSLFPPLSLLTLAGMTPEDRFRILVRDEHVEPVEVDDDVDLVAMTVYVSSAERSYELADMYRARGAKVVLGGIHPTTMPFEAAQHADAICVGPAESVWPQILHDFERGELKNIYRGTREAAVAINPLPRRDLMNEKAYLVRNTLLTSLGCPHACAFCCSSRLWGQHYYRQRPIEAIERELQAFRGRLVFLLDNDLFSNRFHATEVFRLLRGSGFIWQAAASLDVARRPDLLHKAYEAGCRSLFVGFESLSPHNMRHADKPVNASIDFAEAVRRIHEAGIMINGSFMFGFDGDGPDVFDRTLEFTIENKLETATFHILTPFPGTPMFDRMHAERRLFHRIWSLYDTRHAVFQPRRMSPDQLEEGYRRAYDEFYRFGSILQRSAGLPDALKRVACNIGWKRMDRLWPVLIRWDLIPFVRIAFERILAHGTPPDAVCVPRTQSSWKKGGYHHAH